MSRIAAVRAPGEAIFEQLRAVLADGDVPLVGDERWPAAQWADVCALAAAASVPDDAAWASLTSGSSGQQRIVLRTAASWRESFATVAALLDAGPDDQVALPGPAASSLTLFSLAHWLTGDGPVPLLGRASLGATCFHGTPQALSRLLDAPAITVRRALVGGSHLDPALRVAAEARGIEVIPYYGAAELSFVAVDRGDGLRPFPGVELEIRDQVVWVRSPFVALGYVGRPGPLKFDGDWASVGDLADFTDGRLHLRGRADQAIQSASATVIPEEVEATLRRLHGVADALVFGLPHPEVGEVVAALIEPDDSTVDPAELRRGAARWLAPANRPRVWFVGSWPKTATGKPARAEARRLALAGEVARVWG